MIELFPLEDYHTIRLPEPIRIGIVSHFIRTALAMPSASTGSCSSRRGT